MNIRDMRTNARYSPGRKYRYTLTRSWDNNKPNMAVIGLNPSTTDELMNDPIIERIMRRAMNGGFGSFTMLNLFAIRATDPKVMLAHKRPITEDSCATIGAVAFNYNDLYIVSSCMAANQVFCAWGTHGSHLGRAETVETLLINRGIETYCWGWNKSGQPKHPLYIPYSAEPQLFLPKEP